MIKFQPRFHFNVVEDFFNYIEIEDIEEITSKEIKPLIQKVNLIKKYVDDKKKEETEEEKQ